METQVLVTPDTVIKVVATLAPEQLRTVYEFALFIQFRSGIDTEDDLEDDARWTRHLATFRNKESGFMKLRAKALAEIETGETEPMFDDAGEFAP